MDSDSLKVGCVFSALAAVALIYFFPWIAYFAGGAMVLGILGLIYSSKFSRSAREEAALKGGNVQETLTAYFERGEEGKVIQILRSNSSLRMPQGVQRQKLVEAARALLKLRKASLSTTNKYIPQDLKDVALRNSIASATALFSLAERLTLAHELTGGSKVVTSSTLDIAHEECDTITKAANKTLDEFAKLTVGHDASAIAEARRNIESVGWQAAEMNKLEQMLSGDQPLTDTPPTEPPNRERA